MCYQQPDGLAGGFLLTCLAASVERGFQLHVAAAGEDVTALARTCSRWGTG